MDKVRRLLAVAVLSLGLFAPGVARADALDTILNVLYTGGVIDGAVVQAKPLIQCLAGGGSVSSCSQQAAGQQAGALAASDPKIKLVVDIVLATNKGDWPTVVELTGVDLLVQLACSAGMPGGGAVKDFICGGAFAQVAQLGKPVVREVLLAVGKGDWWRLVSLLGPNLACTVIPSSVPLKSQICGPLAAVLNELANLADDAVETAQNLANQAYEAVDGQSPHMSYDEYYSRYLSAWVHTRVVERLVLGRSGLGLDPDQWSRCVDYFDSHEQAHDTAEKTCTDLGHRLHNESELLANAIEPAPAAYHDAFFKDSQLVRDVAADNYNGNSINEHKSYVNSVAPTDWRYGAMVGAPLAADLKPVYLSCMDYMLARFPIKPQTVMRMDVPTVWNWACWQAAGKSLANTIQLERMRLAFNVIPMLKNAGCHEYQYQYGSNKRLTMQCDSYPALAQCKQSFAGYRNEHCIIDPQKADAELAQRLIGTLGAKRCSFLPYPKPNKYYPLLRCTRPWKADECQQLLNQARTEQPGMNSALECNFLDEVPYMQARAEARAIIDALNAEPEPEQDPAQGQDPAQEEAPSGGMAPGGVMLEKTPQVKQMQARKPLINQLKFMNCTMQPEDPLTIDCREPAVVSELSKRLPGAELPKCAPDPKHDGVDAPCYAGVYVIPSPAGGRKQVDIEKLAALRAGDKKKMPLPGARHPQAPADDGRKAGAPALPGGKPRSASPPASGKAASPLAKVTPAAREQADLAAAPQLSVGGRSARWNGTVQLNGAALSATGGQCRVALQYTVQNRGKAAAAAARAGWSGGRIPNSHNLGRLAAGASRPVDASVELAPGSHRLTLVLDTGNAVAESNEGNNRYAVTVVIAGTCGAARTPAPAATPTPAAPRTPAPTSSRGGVPSLPVQR